MDVLYLCTGLQASPSKHTSYSVRMENAVPIVTQAPGAQPLQIQPGLLTQVGKASSAQFLCIAVNDTITKLDIADIQTKLSVRPYFPMPSPSVESIKGSWLESSPCA